MSLLPKYRLLGPGDLIEPDDEFIEEYRLGTLKQARRALPAHPAPDKEDAPERCEGGSPECGPVEHHDSEGVPLCAKCWAALVEDAAKSERGDE